MHLTDPLTTPLLRTTPPFLAALKGLGIHIVQDFLLVLPRGYEDLSALQTLSIDQIGKKISVRGMLQGIKLIRTRRGKYLVQATFTDTEGATAEVIWFNQPHLKRMLREDTDVVLTGKLGVAGRKLQLQSPSFEEPRDTVGTGEASLRHSGRIVPIYPEHPPLSSRWMREKIPLVISASREFHETLPGEIVRSEGLMARADAIHELHAPRNFETLARARSRFAFEELYAVQAEALARKALWQRSAQQRLAVPMDVDFIKAFFASLTCPGEPRRTITPTDSQRIAIYEILRDLEKSCPMSRLLEGDVGSGKTLVAVAVIALVIKQGGQCAIMVPTEILAHQHAESITKLLLNFRAFLEEHPPGSTASPRPSDPLRQWLSRPPPTIALLTGSTPRAETEEIRRRTAAGLVDLLIGTHALIEDAVEFRNLVLAIVDEQHRFGVAQRDRLAAKGSPHVLSMTATPIPRTLALTAYGDHDLSVLLEKPGNRVPIHTAVVPPSDRRTVELFVDREIGRRRQVYVICPLIAESDELAEVRSAIAEAERLRGEVFRHRRIGLLHGQLTPKEKQVVMQAFKDRALDLLVTTAVIEVGIDISNATIILIEGAERFGLAQLHQFRGRVGRGDAQSHCFLFTTTPEQARSERLQAMVQYDNGFQLAEVDLRLRGPGELFGTRQSGLPDFRFANLTDLPLVLRARKAAERTLGGAVVDQRSPTPSPRLTTAP